MSNNVSPDQFMVAVYMPHTARDPKDNKPTVSEHQY